MGGGYYEKCTYKSTDLPKKVKREYSTYFIQEALTEIFCKNWVKEDEVIIFLTHRAKEENYLENKKKKVPRTNDKFEHRKGLKNDLESHNYGFTLKDIYIEDGNSMKEIWDNFEIIINEINDGDEIIFDITHAFRYIPILALVVLNYAKSLKNIKINGIYYGNYEYKNEAYNNPEFSNDEKPIMNLVQLDEILEWSQAVDSFVKYGNSDHIKNFAKEVLRRNKNIDYYKKEEKVIKDLVNSLNDFTNTVQTCRGRTVEQSDSTNSITKAYEKLVENLDLFMQSEKNSMKPLRHIIGKIEDSLGIFKKIENREEIINTGLGIVHWSLNNNLIQQAYTALLETIVSYMCILEGENYNNRESREEVKKYYNNIYYDNRFLKSYEIQGDIKNEIARISYKLSCIRNDVNHYGYCMKSYEENKPSKSYNDLKNIIKQNYKEFENCVVREEKKQLVLC